MATKRKIMLDCLRQLSMVYGTSVNTYAEDKIYAMIDDALETVFKDRFWQRHIKKEKFKLVNGYPENSDLNMVCREFEDIMTIVDGDNINRELTKANFSIVPDNISATRPLMFQGAYENPEKVFRCLPVSDNVDVWVIFRTLCKPATYKKFLNGETIIPEADKQFEYLPEDEIPFDALAIKYKTCHSYMMIKGDNMEATANFDRLYKERIYKLECEETNNTLSYYNSSSDTFQNGWWDNG